MSPRSGDCSYSMSGERQNSLETVVTTHGSSSIISFKIAFLELGSEIEGTREMLVVMDIL